jgi:hypothetical protein
MTKDYSKSKVYKIWSTLGDMIYIGSTTKEYLSQRMTAHRYGYIDWKKHNHKFITSYKLFDEYGVDNCIIELLEAKELKNNDEIRQLEGGYIRNMACVNKNIAGRTIEEARKEYYQQNKEARKEYNQQNKEARKEYYQQNKEAQKEYSKQHYQQNKEVIKEYNQQNKEVIKEYKKEYYLKNKEANIEVSKQYYQQNKEAKKEYNKQYRLKIKLLKTNPD